MQRATTLLRMVAVVAVCGLATFALPLSAHAGVRVSIGLGGSVSPVPVVVAPSPAVVYPAPVIVTHSPVVVAPPVVYRTPATIREFSTHSH